MQSFLPHILLFTGLAMTGTVAGAKGWHISHYHQNTLMEVHLRPRDIHLGLGGVGWDYDSLLHSSMFWGLFLGLQPSGAAARLCVPAEWFQRIILTTVANTQPERVVQYDSDAIATASLKKAITIYNIQGCTVIQYLQYLIPQPPVVKREFEDTRCKVSFPSNCAVSERRSKHDPAEQEDHTAAQVDLTEQCTFL